MKKLLIIIPLIVLLVFLTGCGKTVKPKARPIDVTGNWTVKNPPKPPIPKGMPKGYVPPTPTYILTFSTSDGQNQFALAMPDQTPQGTNSNPQNNTINTQGTYILSGATIQLVPAGKNFVFEFGKTEKDDQIQGDGFVWTRSNSNGSPSSPTAPIPSNQPTPSNQPIPSNQSPSQKPIPLNH
jgi:hypothetical protein